MHFSPNLGRSPTTSRLFAPEQVQTPDAANLDGLAFATLLEPTEEDFEEWLQAAGRPRKWRGLVYPTQQKCDKYPNVTTPVPS